MSLATGMESYFTKLRTNISKVFYDINFQGLEESFNKEVQKAVEKRLKNEGYNPPKDTSGNTLTLESIKNMSQAEINNNWDKVKEILKNK